jgi:hypothetical protein
VGDSWRGLLEAKAPRVRYEPLATLGDALALCRRSISFEERADVGPMSIEQIAVIEVGGDGRLRHGEAFAEDRLADGVVRLYVRFAEFLPDGPARTRAAATARSVAALLGPPDLDRFASAWAAPDVEVADHRTPSIFESGRGSEYLRRGLGSLFELAEFAVRLDDVVHLASDALLVSVTIWGTDRTGGGAFEQKILGLWVFGADGLATHNALFDIDCRDEALARFDELVAEPPAARARTKVHGRVRANAATAHVARIEAVIAARDADALPTLLAEESEVIDYVTGVAYDRQGQLASLQVILKAENSMVGYEILATLGDSLVLCRMSMSASAFVGRTFDVGAYEQVEIHLNEVDAEGRGRRTERYAVDRLGDAVLRLYERYAELLPAGPARERAAATARSVATLLQWSDRRQLEAAFEPGVEGLDHRIAGFGSVRGIEQFRPWFETAWEMADGLVEHFDEFLVAQPNALVVRCTTTGRERAGGGAFEWPHLRLYLFGGSGLVTRVEVFDAGREQEALARFDELTAEPAPPRFANAAARAGLR